MDFVTGLVVGRNEAAAVSQEWAEFADGLEQEVGGLRQRLYTEQVERTKNRADIAGLMAVLKALPADVLPVVLDAFNKNYGQAYVNRASELGLNPSFAVDCANVAIDDVWEKIVSKPR